MRADVIATLIFLLFPLGGPEKISREKILESDRQWQQNYDACKTEPELLDILKSKLDDRSRIDVYLGLWCSDSRQNVPPFIKIIDQLKTTAAVNFYAVDRKPSKDIQYYVEVLKVERVPTFIVYRHDKEIGRIIENPKGTILDDLIQIVLTPQ